MSKRRSSTKPAPPEPIFFIDADLSDSVFHQVLADADVRFERHNDHFEPGTDDLSWLVKAGEQDWIVLSHNKRMRWESAQTERLMQAGVRAIMLIGTARPNPQGQRSVFTRDLAENFVRSLPTIRRFLKRHPKPWIARLYRPTGLAQSNLPRPGELRMWLTLQQYLRGRE